MKAALTTMLLTLLLSMGAWAEDELKTIMMSFDEFEADPILKGKDTQLFMLKRCAAAFEVLMVMGYDQMDETADKFSQDSIRVRKKIGNEGGLDKTRDQIITEVSEDIKNNKDTYIKHLLTWNESIGKDSEEMFSEPFRDDLRVCVAIIDQF